MELITLEDVHFSYHDKPILQGMSASFQEGVLTSVVGPNGCGKSTMVKLIDGLLRPQAGTIRLKGKPTQDYSGKERAQLVSVLAQSSRPPAMPVEMLVGCGRYPYQRMNGRQSADDQAHIEHAMELAGIAELRHKDVRRLSGGERQRAYIAMTIAQDTDIIILDEPTTYLDIRACHDVMELLQTLVVQGKTIVMVIHDLDLALRYSNQLVVMENGQVLTAGSVPQVLASGALEQAFGVDVVPSQSCHGISYALFPNKQV